MKNFKFVLMSLLVAFSISSQIATAQEMSSADYEFMQSLPKDTKITLMAKLGAHNAGLSAACVASAVPVLLAAVGDSIPLVNIFTYLGSGGKLSPYSARHDMAPFVGGAVNGIGGTIKVAFDWLLGKEGEQKYKYTKVSYNLTAKTAKAFYGESSRCQKEFGKIVLIKAELARRAKTAKVCAN
jgi:hypothetical protein